MSTSTSRPGADPPPACNCPLIDGMIRHWRSTCTDPVVALLGWYADDPDYPLPDH